MTLPNRSMVERKELNKRQLLDIRGGRMQQASMILNRIEQFALGATEKVMIDGEEVEVKVKMSNLELRAAEIHLRKILPDLSMVQQVTDNPNQVRSVTEMEDELKLLAENSPLIGRLLGILPPVNG